MRSLGTINMEANIMMPWIIGIKLKANLKASIYFNKQLYTPSGNATEEAQTYDEEPAHTPPDSTEKSKKKFQDSLQGMFTKITKNSTTMVENFAKTTT